MTEVAFLQRLYDLDALPSDDRLFATAAGDIAQHRAANYEIQEQAVPSGAGGRALELQLDPVCLGQYVQPVAAVQQDCGCGALEYCLPGRLRPSFDCSRAHRAGSRLLP